MSPRETYRAVPKQTKGETSQKSGKTNQLPQDKKAADKSRNLGDRKDANMRKSDKRS